MRHSGTLARAALVALIALPAAAQVPPSLPPTAIRPPPEQDSPLTRPIAPPVSRAAPGPGSDVAETLAKAGIRPSRDTLTGLDEKAADGALYAVEEKSGLPRSLRDLADQPPPDPGAVIRQLGLSDPPARRMDFRGRTPTVDEIVDALRPR